MKKILLVNGPNLNLLGLREPEFYGTETLADIEKKFAARCSEAGIECLSMQSNSEGAIIDFIHENRHADAMVINPAGLSHTSISLRDAITATSIRTVEVHISNIFSREEFRWHSHISGVAEGIVCGLGTAGYIQALEYLLSKPRR